MILDMPCLHPHPGYDETAVDSIYHSNLLLPHPLWQVPDNSGVALSCSPTISICVASLRPKASD